MIYFTSDLHFGHDNIIKYSNRPFRDVHEMNRQITLNWNSVVGKNDTIYCIGDFAFGKGKNKPHEYFKKLNGKKHLIRGNHDADKTADMDWESVHDLLEINVGKQRIVMCHYSMRVWHHSYKGTWQLYGHSHGTLPEQETLSCDVGTDVWNYTPVSLETLKRKMTWKKENPGHFNKIHKPSEDVKHHKTSEVRSNDDMEKCRKEIAEFNLRFAR